MTTYTCQDSGITFETNDTNCNNSYKDGYIAALKECKPFMCEWIAVKDRLPEKHSCLHVPELFQLEKIVKEKIIKI